MTLRFALLTPLTLLALLAAMGCTSVKPYEREYLARPGMDPKHEGGGARFSAHVRDAREGAIGASGESTGGGCGCN